MSEKFILIFILLHDINDISVLPYEFHVVQLSCNAYVSLAVCLLFHEGKQKIFTNCSCSGSRRDCNTFKKDLGLFQILFFTVVTKMTSYSSINDVFRKCRCKIYCHVALQLILLCFSLYLVLNRLNYERP